MREWMKNALLFGASTLVGLAGIELGLRYIGDDLALGNQYAFYRFDPKLGWTNTPGETGNYVRREFSYPISNNQLGMRDEEVGEKQPGEKRVAVLGDSFTWAVGAADEERFTAVVEKLDPAFDVLNFGVSGYGTVQQSLMLDQVLALTPDTVVVAFCLGTDILDNVYPFRYGYHKPTAELDAGGGVRITGYPLYEAQSFGSAISGGLSDFRIVGLVRQFLRRRAEKAWMAENGREVRYSLKDAQLYASDASLTEDERVQREQVVDIAASLLDQMNDKVTAAIGPDRFIVLFVPTKFEAGIADQTVAEPNRLGDMLKQRLDALGVAVVDGRPVITPNDFWALDGHWRPIGHEKIGRLLATELAERLTP